MSPPKKSLKKARSTRKGLPKGSRLIANMLVGYTEVEVWEVPGLEDDGVWNASSNRILINASLKDRARRGTVLHERLHAISDQFGLGLSEVKVSVLENELMRKVKRCEG